MLTAELRQKFIEFFQSKGHTRVDSSPLIPAGDPTLLFTNSGMVQFKDVFLGFDKRSYKTAVTAQRCLRAGGKHNDLENVGYTARHHTFFEMLGNFSFGEYFKEKAIPYAWEFLTSPQWLGLKKEHLWITVFGGGQLFGKDKAGVPPDEESVLLWRRTLIEAGFSEEAANNRITRVPTTDNFWMMGETGPCGPCSEIFYDKEASSAFFRGEEEKHADDCVEIWNLVFMQYNRDDAGVLHSLPVPCVDTGMGLERAGAILQGVASNYDIDLFANLIEATRKETKTRETMQISASHRVIADHIRSAAFLIGDDVLPANEGRGYVLRRIIRRALRHIHKINPHSGDCFYRLVKPLADIMGEAFPVLRERQEFIAETIKQEENNFFHLLRNGMRLLDEEIEKIKQAGGEKRLSGELIFKLYDTFGFPHDMTAAIARDLGWFFDEEGFDVCMHQQRARSQAATKFSVSQKTVTYEGDATEFTGYSCCDGEATVIALYVDGERVKEVGREKEAIVILNRTPFYAESGGQIGDTGIIKGRQGSLAQVTDTQKLRTDVWGHMVCMQEGVLNEGEMVMCHVDDKRRKAIMRAHSSAHLLHAALRQILGQHVQQRGSHVSQDTVRFDISHSKAVTAEELREVEVLVNEEISRNVAVETEVMSFDDALKTGAMALFGEKYGDNVRVVTMNPEFSIELCGGTHVSRAGDIGLFQFTGESAIAAGVRRVEAVTAGKAIDRVQRQNNDLSRMAILLKTPVDHLEEKIIHLRDTLKESQKQIDELKTEQLLAKVQTIKDLARDINNRQVIVHYLNDIDVKGLRVMAKQLGEQFSSPTAILLVGRNKEELSFVAITTKHSGINANMWLQEVASFCGAKGGGKAHFAQAGGGTSNDIEKIIDLAQTYIKNQS